MRHLVRRPAAPAVLALLRRSARRIGAALMYHRVDDAPGDPQTELVPAVGVADFEEDLRLLHQRYAVVPATQLPEAIESRRAGGPIPVAITFDDDLACHRRVAAPALQRHGLTATFFLSGASLDGPRRFWWELLQDAVERGEDVAGALEPFVAVPDVSAHEDPGLIHPIAFAITQLDPATRDQVEERLHDLAGPDPAEAGLRADDVAWLADSGFEVGFHTRRHDYLPNLDDDALARAMREGRDRLAEVTGRPLRSIAYPHGGADIRVAGAARKAGFSAGFTTRTEAAGATTNRLLLGRIDPAWERRAVASELPWYLRAAA